MKTYNLHQYLTISAEFQGGDKLCSLVPLIFFRSNNRLRETMPADLVDDVDLPPTTRLFVAFLDNLRLSSSTLERFVDLYRQHKVCWGTSEFKMLPCTFPIALWLRDGKSDFSAPGPGVKERSCGQGG